MKSVSSSPSLNTISSIFSSPLASSNPLSPISSVIFRSILSKLPHLGPTPSILFCFARPLPPSIEPRPTKEQTSSKENLGAERSLIPWLLRLRDHLLLADIYAAGGGGGGEGGEGGALKALPFVDLAPAASEDGAALEELEEKIKKVRFVILVGTNSLVTRETNGHPFTKKLLDALEKKRDEDPSSLLVLMRNGDLHSAVPSRFQKQKFFDFREAGYYYDSFLNILSEIYAVKQNDDFNRVAANLDLDIDGVQDKFWNIPAPSSLILDRPEALKELMDHALPLPEPLVPGEPSKVLVINGPAGTGKSQLALRLATELFPSFTLGWLVNAESERSLLSGLVDLAQTTGLLQVDKLSPSQTAHTAFELLVTKGKRLFPWLLVLDNLDCAGAEQLIQPFLKFHGGLIIITARQPLSPSSLPPGSHQTSLSCFSPELSQTLLERYARSPRSQATADLASLLAHHPLSLSLAGACLDQGNLTPEALLAQLHSQQPESSEEPEDDPPLEPAEHSLAKILRVAITHLAARFPESLVSLQRLAYLTSSQIPQALLAISQGTPLLQEQLSLGFLQGCSFLIGSDLITNMSSVHPSVTRLLPRLCYGPSFVNPIECVEGLLGNMVELLQERDLTPTDLRRRRILQPHADTLATHANSLMIGDSLNVARLLLNCSLISATLEDQLSQKRYLEQALPIFEHHYGDDHIQVASTLINLALANGALGDPASRKALLERALVIQENHLGKEHFQISKTLTHLATSYGESGDHQRQRELLEHVLEIKRRHFGTNHFEVAKTLSALAATHGHLGNSAKQQELLAQVEEIKKPQSAPPVSHGNEPHEGDELAGYLLKLGGALFSRSFQNRYFVYKKQKKLIFWTSTPSQLPKNHLNLSEVRFVKPLAQSEYRKDFCFCLGTKSKNYILAAPDQVTYEKWLSTLLEATK